jgi:hypothetical protein
VDLEKRARAYLTCIEEARSFDELAPFFHPDIRLVEYPNRLVPNGKCRFFPHVAQAFESGRKAVLAQTYKVRNVIVAGSSVALEVEWEGTLAVPLGSLEAGATLSCDSAMFLHFDAEGRILRQENYDCFAPF